MDNNEHYYVSLCLEKIEAIFDRGSSADWVMYDFEKLSAAIQERTQVNLSVTTLKRLWGKLKYNSAPTVTTLNALSQFAGYTDWRDFMQQHDQPIETACRAETPTNPQKSRLQFAGIAILALSVAAYFFLSAGNKRTRYDPDQFDFRANKIETEGVPNSVIFHYDARVKPDSLFIVQTWDISRKTLVSSEKHEHSAIYYYPGFFNTKLIADGQIVKSHDLWITSDGWLCLLEEMPIPIYLKKENCQREDGVEVDEQTIGSYRKPGSPSRVRFFNQRDLGDMMNDNFTFETMLKNDFDDGTNTCHYVEVLIQCKDDIIIIPLAAKPCVGDLSLYFCGAHAQSASADLSGFGADLTQWTSLRVVSINQHVSIFVNDVKAYSLTFPNTPRGIVGVQYRFNGPAAVKQTRFIANGKTIDMN